jgi:hypothetical protein
MRLQKKLVNDKRGDFLLRVKIGEYEVELSGAHAEVMKTVENLPDLIVNINKAFESVKPKTVATITVKTAQQKQANKASEAPAQNYPKIAATEDAEEAVLRTLETEWGKWRPRTAEELRETLEANNLKQDSRVLESALEKLSKKGKVRRWNTNTGFVYILAEEKPLSSGSK